MPTEVSATAGGRSSLPVLLIQFSSLSEAYFQANRIKGEIEILEILAKGALLCRGEEAVLQTISEEFLNTDHCLLEGKNAQKVLDTFYSLRHSPVRSSILMLESNSLVEIFKTADAWLKQGILIHDLKASRVSTDPHLLIGTTAGDPMTANLTEGVRVLYPIHPEIQKFFDLEVK